MRMCLAVTTVLALSAVCFAEPPDPIEQLKTEPSQLRLFILKQDQQIDALKKELDRTKERLQALEKATAGRDTLRRPSIYEGQLGPSETRPDLDDGRRETVIERTPREKPGGDVPGKKLARDDGGEFPEKVPEYEVLRKIRILIGVETTVRFSYKIGVRERVFEEQIESICQDLIRKEPRPYSAIFFQFYVPGKPKKVLIARAEWAPFGDWDLADKAPPGVYKNHELTIRLHK